MTSIPVLAVTLGDVAGIGPEITARTLLRHPELRAVCVPVVIGDEAALRTGCEVAGLDPDAVTVIASVEDASNDPSLVEVVQLGPSLADVRPGELSAAAGDGAYRFVVEACRLGREGRVQGIVTAPLNKAAMHLGGHHWPGHTEILAHEFGVTNYSMILASEHLNLFHLTTHQSLKSAVDSCTPERTTAVINLAHALARALGQPDAPIGLCGINPHAGEGGLFGDEDALILQAVKGKWNFVIACYHDQGHAPFKAVYGDNGVNITSGLPVVRVSVDHGTAFDIAGRGIASEASLVVAVTRAAALSGGWKAVWDVASQE